MSISLISIALKLLAAKRGDLVCFMYQSQSNDTQQYAGAEQFIVSSRKCLEKVFHGDGGNIKPNIPYILFVLTLILALMDKFSYRIEKFDQKIERFHTIIVKEGLLSSKDPELTEDINDVKASKEAISRGRQRDELSAELKNGSVLYYFYIGKNILTLLFVVFIVSYFYSQDLHVHEQASMANCTHEESLAIKPNEIAICQQRFSRQFHLFHLLHFGVMVVYALCCVGCLVFCLGFRPVTNFIFSVCSLSEVIANGTQNGKKHVSLWNVESGDLRKFNRENINYPGKDFIFLFDLLAHNYGLESTLKMLSHCDQEFHNLLTPKATVQKRKIDKLLVEWSPCELEILFDGSKPLTYKAFFIWSVKRKISIDNYQITVLQKAEKTEKIIAKIEILAELKDSGHYNVHSKKYSTEFGHLQGGQNEYIVTITSVIGESRMKGERLETFLVPFDPKPPIKGMVEKVDTHQIEIKWIPPFGDFTKYILSIQSEEGKRKMEPPRKECLSSKDKDYTVIGFSSG